MGIFNWKKKNSEFLSNEELVEAKVCPNCWGSQEYDNKVRVLMEEKQIDVNNHTTKHAFIKDFVVNHVEGIHIHKEEDDVLSCPKCNARF